MCIIVFMWETKTTMLECFFSLYSFSKKFNFLGDEAKDLLFGTSLLNAHCLSPIILMFIEIIKWVSFLSMCEQKIPYDWFIYLYLESDVMVLLLPSPFKVIRHQENWMAKQKPKRSLFFHRFILSFIFFSSRSFFPFMMVNFPLQNVLHLSFVLFSFLLYELRWNLLYSLKINSAFSISIKYLWVNGRINEIFFNCVKDNMTLCMSAAFLIFNPKSIAIEFRFAKKKRWAFDRRVIKEHKTVNIEASLFKKKIAYSFNIKAHLLHSLPSLVLAKYCDKETDALSRISNGSIHFIPIVEWMIFVLHDYIPY